MCSSLRAVWEAVCRSTSFTGITEAAITKWWQELSTNYSGKQRHYHTLDHLSDMMHLWQEKQTKLHTPNLVAFAVFFHDMIYDPKAGDNEEQSAEVFHQFAKEVKLERQDAETVAEWILLTKFHTTDAHTNAGVYGSGDEHFLLDMDMAVLGWPKEKYLQYSEQIRQEYIHVPLIEYCDKRAQVLESFLKIENIYATEDFRNSHESQARSNLKEEILRLRAKHSELTQ